MFQTAKGYVYRAAMPQLRAMLDLVRQAAMEAGFGDGDLGKIELAAEEALTNIIRYAYPEGQEGTVEITCSVPSAGVLRLAMRDQGEPFNPLEEAPAVDLHAPLEYRPIGGLGLFLIQQIMDDVSYERDGTSNILILNKKMSRSRD